MRVTAGEGQGEYGNSNGQWTQTHGETIDQAEREKFPQDGDIQTSGFMII